MFLQSLIPQRLQRLSAWRCRSWEALPQSPPWFPVVESSPTQGRHRRTRALFSTATWLRLQGVCPVFLVSSRTLPESFSWKTCAQRTSTPDGCVRRSHCRKTQWFPQELMMGGHHESPIGRQSPPIPHRGFETRTLQRIVAKTGRTPHPCRRVQQQSHGRAPGSKKARVCMDTSKNQREKQQQQKKPECM